MGLCYVIVAKQKIDKERWMEKELLLLKKLTILFAEDDLLVQSQVASLLSIFFERVLVADTGKMAYELYEDEKPDIILSDLHMPQMDGFALFEAIRRIDCHTPIIVLSAYSDSDILLQALNSGVDGYIVKPIELETLINTFKKILSKIPKKSATFSFENGLIYNTLTEELFKENEQIDLGKKEKMLLKLFIQNENRVIEKDEIIFTIWPHDDVSESALKNLLNRLRNKIGFELIVSVKGSGWKLNTTR